MEKRMEISDKTSVAMPIKNMIGIIAAISVGTWAYFGVLERLNKLQSADLLKKAEQTPKNLEMLMLIEHNASIIDKHQKQLDDNIHTKVLLREAEKKIEKLQKDVEELKHKKNG